MNSILTNRTDVLLTVSTQKVSDMCAILSFFKYNWKDNGLLH